MENCEFIMCGHKNTFVCEVCQSLQEKQEEQNDNPRPTLSGEN